MVETVLPSSLRSAPRGKAASASRARASLPCLDPICVGTSAGTGSKRPGSNREGEPPAKRRRDAAGAPPMSSAEKDGINRLLLSLLPPGLSPPQVNPLSDSVVRVLQDNGNICRYRSGGGADDEIEIEVDVQALDDEALHAIRDCVTDYLADKARREEDLPLSREGVTGQSAARITPSKTASKGVQSLAATKRIQSHAASKKIEVDAQALGDEALREIRDCTTTFLADRTQREEEAGPLSREGNVGQSAARSVPSKTASKSFPSQAASKRIQYHAASKTPKAPAPPKPSENMESARMPVLNTSSHTSTRSSPPKASSSLPSSPETTKSVRELLDDARKAMEEIVRQRERQRERAAARRVMDRIVRTVEFNDPYIDVQDAFK